MGQVICEIRILDGTETICYYAIWNTTSGEVESKHPLFEDRETAKLYLDLLPNNPDMQIKLNKEYHSISMVGLQEWMRKKLIKGDGC